MLLCALGTLATAIVTVLCTAQVSAGLSANLRSVVFNKSAVLFYAGNRKIFHIQSDYPYDK